MARVFYHTSGIVVLGSEVNPEMPQMKSKAVSKGSDPVPNDKSGLGGLTMEEIRQYLEKNWTKASIDRQATSTMKGLKTRRRAR